ncbi:MAG: 3-deoxy-manno-octulosonate cytidylyltransferase [Bdellovibrionota bacterium]|nr:MAG: 3-deoxy-manno-octulosonate cytidylyltransferase [Bdellovibrionota bacterium]
MKVLGIIPARIGSTRLPAKALKFIGDKTVVQRVWEQATKAACFEELFVATDSSEIADCVKGFGGSVLMTGSHHATGSDRVAEALELREKAGKHFDLVANVQGDMPFIEPGVIRRTVQCLAEADPTFGMSTVVMPLFDENEFKRDSVVKVVLGVDGRALYFSRAPIPHRRDPEKCEISPTAPIGYKHFGLYVFRPATLKALNKMSPSLIETREALEQLRALANGILIKAAFATPEEMNASIEIDTSEDLSRAVAAVQSGKAR